MGCGRAGDQVAEVDMVREFPSPISGDGNDNLIDQKWASMCVLPIKSICRSVCVYVCDGCEVLCSIMLGMGGR